MKRTPLKRSRARWSKGYAKGELEAREAFKGTVEGALCAVCKAAWPLEAHHVVEAQELRRRELPPYDNRNALPLCGTCHERHTNASRRVPFRKLRAANIDYAYEVLGPFAADYLRRKYPMTGNAAPTEEKGP